MTQEPAPILVVDDDGDMCLTIQDILDGSHIHWGIVHANLRFILKNEITTD